MSGYTSETFKHLELILTMGTFNGCSGKAWY
ncbi:MAG: hypothetical protein BWY93_01346 [Euryarchaeota archaeon ADurb.BinA087]|nr:MAG: hypothetical protein BWY93_01346 [Euryarchaeota archaeon ADurb.BinA087]